ncbi:thymidine phosphorylase [Variovorax sp. WS11]|uniref:thymidine phosphorylase n=1 Tax=Variovorax sp. WS11 TaxID=1105204 RepID=UPI000D0E2928|nr:thymidine phosphorylase [Variovorax sp. WS11]NDZ15184.1 thymidine phosphorylase [Variovorax sp. WS11]PSL85421.1 thymidine phosphorylase [Variovorax sp. WS11]
MLLPAEVIRAKRDRHALAPAQIEAFVRGLIDGSWSEGQAAALSMAILLNGMDPGECVALTRAMTHSGEVLRWPDMPGPVLDKHSTGGVGDKVSLMLAPIVAACGGVVPMISGRGLGHTGGTLDKLESLPGYGVEPSRETLLAVLRDAGCAIVGAGPTLAPADKRLYAIRDVTATVESVPLITASILSKKLAAGLQGLVLDVKVGNGAFMPGLDDARALAGSLVAVASGAGLPAQALITDMNQVLGHSAGNAVEVREAIDFLSGVEREPRLLEVTLALAARLLCLGGLAAGMPEARAQALRALDSGAAAERFARMVAGLGGAGDLRQAVQQLPAAPVQCDVPALQDGVLAATDVRAIGLAIVALGGGRRRAGDRIDTRVGLTQVLPLGASVRKGQPLARVHAASQGDAEAAVAALQAAMHIDENPRGPAALPAPGPVICEEITQAPSPRSV